MCLVGPKAPMMVPGAQSEDKQLVTNRFWVPWGPLLALGGSIFEVNTQLKGDTQRSSCFCATGVCFGFTVRRVGGAWEAVWTAQA